MREIHEILGDLGWKILSMKEAGIDLDIVEDGTTFEENALIKAKTIYDKLHIEVIADGEKLRHGRQRFARGNIIDIAAAVPEVIAHLILGNIFANAKLGNTFPDKFCIHTVNPFYY